jgi:hypothetical protein
LEASATAYSSETLELKSDLEWVRESSAGPWRKLMSTQGVHTDFDPVKAEAFAARLLGTLNNGALCLMLSVGHRTGLFDVMSTSSPATSEEIATRAGLNERYVREWLGAMATARVVDVRADDTAFFPACRTRHVSDAQGCG